MGGAFLSTLLMFMWVVRLGEVGRLILFETDTGRDFSSGIYFLPNLFPFVRGIDLVLGYGLVITERLYTNNTQRNINHYVDQRLPTYRVDVKTDSLFRANLDRKTNLFFKWLFTTRGRDGHVEYYRVGRIGFLVMIIAALICSVIAPRKEYITPFALPSLSLPSFLQQVNTPEKPRLQSVTIDPEDSNIKVVTTRTQLEAGQMPTIPPDSLFEVEIGDTLHFVTIGGRKYIKYLEKSDGGGFAIIVNEPLCSIVPAGKKVNYLTNRRPEFALNMKQQVNFAQQTDHLPQTFKLGILLFEEKDGKSRPSYRRDINWNELFKMWNTADTSRIIMAEALPSSEIPDRVPGGIVCF